MTRVAKLYAMILANPKASITFAQFERLLGAAGFRHVRTKGSHRHYAHPHVRELLTVLPDGKGVKPYLLKRFLEIIDEYGLDIGS